MVLTPMKEVFQPERTVGKGDDKRTFEESYNLLCIDMSQPPQDRMEELLHYRMNAEERALYWGNGKTVGKLLTVGVHRIRHSDSGGRASIMGRIISCEAEGQPNITKTAATK